MVEKANRRPRAGKVYYQISEVAQLTGVNESTLRNWEEQYDELRNVRRINNRRHYTAADIANIEKINEKRSVKDVQIAESETVASGQKLTSPTAEVPAATGQAILTPERVKVIVKELDVVRKELREIASNLA